MTRDQIEGLFADQRTGDRLGTRIHLGLAMVACFLAGWPTTAVELAAAGVLICFLIRMTGWHRVLEPLAFDWVFRLLLAFGAWAALSILWSVGRDTQPPGSAPVWLMDVRNLRFLCLALVLWPVLDRRAWLIAATVAGIACGQLSQLIHLLGVVFEWPALAGARNAGRISGWWDPVSGGTVLCAGLGLWLAPALWATSARRRWIGTLGALATLACIALTGTRGAWIGAAATIPIALFIRLLTRRDRWASLFWPFGAVCIAAAILGIAALLIGGRDTAPERGLAQRFQSGIQEVRNGFGPEGWRTDTGMRIAMWQWAIAEWKTHPFRGVGAGGYQPWVRAKTPADADRLGAPAGAIKGVHAQAHSTYFHTLATLGAIGFAILLALLIVAIISGLRSARAASGNWLDSLAMGPALGLVGLACAGLFDTITVNQQPSYLLYLLAALCLPSRPRLYEPSAQAEGISRGAAR